MLTDLFRQPTLDAVATPPYDAEVLWPDRDNGPWRLRLYWRIQHGVPTPVGFSMLSWEQSIGELERDLKTRRLLDIGGEDLVLPGPEDDQEFPRLSAALLRSLPVGQLFTDARERIADLLSLMLLPEHLANDSAAGRDWNETIGPDHHALASPRRGRDLGDDHYRAVATTYRQAAKRGQNPTQAVSEEFTISKSAAGKQVARARERGLLPKTSRGRVGPLQEEL